MSDGSRNPDPTSGDLVLWDPEVSGIENSAMATFVDFVNSKHGLNLSGRDYRALHAWTISDTDSFWATLADFMELDLDASAGVSVGSSVEMTRWFPAARINYAEQALRASESRSSADTAVIELKEGGARREVSLGDLRDLVARVRAGLKSRGIGRGDVVVGVVTNSIEALASFLATAALGATWSSCSPEFGTQAIVDRFAQLGPKALIAVASYTYGGRSFDVSPKIEELAKAIPDMACRIVIGDDPAHQAQSGALAFESWESVTETWQPLEFERVGFSHPLWVLFSSGTTGLPKGLIHGHGGIVLEHWKNLRLHHNLSRGSRFFWFTTTGWMMWNYLVSGLLVDATIILYDGSPTWTNTGRLWQLARDEQVDLLGVSAPLVHATMDQYSDLREFGPWPRLKAVGSTGAPLSPEAFDWLSDQLGRDVQICSTSGGTDVCTAFLISAPNLPVWRGELSCAALGVDACSMGQDGECHRDQVGELVLRQALPTMPVGLWGDDGGSRYHETYFSEFDGVWRHGDWCVQTSHDSFIILGRSDATLNRGGVRTGTADYYRVVESLTGVREALVVDLPDVNGRGGILLFVVVDDVIDEDETASVIREAVRSRLSPRHVPDEVHFLKSLPKTLNGKKCEVPVKRILMGASTGAVVNVDSLQDPSSLSIFEDLSRSMSTST